MGKDITVEAFRNEYIEYREGIRERSTVLADDLALRKLCRHVGPLTQLRHVRSRHGDTLMSRCTKQGLKPASVVNHYRHLHTAFNTAAAWEYIGDNPFAKVQPPRIYKTPPKYIPLEDCAAFIAGIEDHDKRMLVTAYLATGRRRCELLNLRWGDINWERNEYTVHVTKIHRDLVFPINDLFRDVLIEQQIFWSQHERVFPRWKNPDSVTHWVKQELTKAGYDHLHLHNFRHSFACGFVHSDGNIYVLMKLLGHSNVNTTMIYADVSRDQLATEVNRVKFAAA